MIVIIPILIIPIKTMILFIPIFNIFIKITSPERLDLLAYRFYGDASKWWIIASANDIKASADVKLKGGRFAEAST